MDLTVSYAPPPEQRDWRWLSRTQVAMHESAVRVRNQIEVLLEQAQIKLSSVVTDLVGKSGRRMLDALPLLSLRRVANTHARARAINVCNRLQK
jgi:hypothetical protein